ncbi:MAG: leucyl aminopeptidase [Pseudomonadales bacterium]|nr:leucyl aminopeptidase [Pseudomonadales bacterium]
MRYSIKAGSPEKISADCVVVPIWNKGTLSEEAKQIDVAANKAISKILQSGDLVGKLGETQLIHNPVGVAAKRVLLVGAGDKKKLNGKAAAKMLGAALKVSRKSQAGAVHFALNSLAVTDRDSAWLAARLSQEAEIASYQYDTTKSKKAKAYATKSVSITALPGSRRKNLEAGLKRGQAIGKAVNRARELGNLPGNVCTPSYLAQQATSLADRNRSVTTQVLSEKQMARLGMGSLLSVGTGSAEESKLIVMRYKGAKVESKPYAIVGKGITFDTGGISLKPGGAMDEMKFDMCGAASVVATMGAVAELKLPINVVGVVAAAENMPSSRATKPGDIVTSMSGKTIEVLNTDAEGRLVLCDALTYVEKFKPRSVIDIATLTGAAVATFGSHANALLSNNDKLAEILIDCGEEVLDRAWQLPLWDDYQSLLNSNFADIANIGGPRAGTITAACFLSRFTEKQKWAHLDIAGSAWHSGAQKGATGRPVSLLVEYLSRQKA